MRLFQTIGAAIASVAIAALPAAVFAQESQTTLVVPRAETAVLIPGHSGGYIDVVVNGQACGRLVFDDAQARDASGDHSLRLDGAGKPAGCATPGAKLMFVNGWGDRLVASLTLARGERNVLTNLAPEPPRTSGDVPPGPPATGISQLVEKRAGSGALQTMLFVSASGFVAAAVFSLVRRRHRR